MKQKGVSTEKILSFVTFLTVLSIGICVLLAYAEPSGETENLIETCSTTWKMGFGAILALLGRKA